MGLSTIEAKAIVERVRQEIEKSKGSRIWGDYVNALKLISQVVFTRSSGFILELIQNAEDAGLGLETPGVLKIKVNKLRVRVEHNGRPFNEDNLTALCGIRSSKKPEEGTLGYLGIGFKSVFKVTDCPEVYSGGFQFKFDRNHKDWIDPSNTPWHVIPLWIDEPTEAVEPAITTFIIHFREPTTYYPALLQEVTKLKTELYLFLRWLKRIETLDEESRLTWTLENLGESSDGITTLKRNGQEQKFKFFRRICLVPPEVKQDRLTQEYRANVAQREVVIAFALDREGNLAPLEAGTMYGGVYSFLPVGEAKSGAKFPIQADFLVQPGREAINYEARWNHWLVEQVAALCQEAIDCFKKHNKWKYQFLPAFEFTNPGGPAYDKLFGPKLIDPIQIFLRDSNCALTIGEEWVKSSQVVRLTENPQASKDLVTMGILDEDEVAPLLGSQDSLKLVHPDFKEPSYGPIKIREVDRDELLKNNAFLEQKRQLPDATEWFRNLYLWLQRHPTWWKSTRGKVYQRQYSYDKIVLAADGQLYEGRGILLPDFAPSDPILKEVPDTLQKSRPVLHPEILGKAVDDEERKVLRGFLTGLCGVQVLDAKTVCKEALLPKILTSAPKPQPDDLVKWTIYCQQILGEEVGRGLEFWVLTNQGDVRSAKETLFPKEFQPERDWETNQQYVPGLNFLSPDYLGGSTDALKLQAWHQFFKARGVKEDPDNGVEVFAKHYAIEKLKSTCTNVTEVDKLNLGYDLEAELPSREKMRIEVKGQTREDEVELSYNETQTADTHKDSYYLCVVCHVPEKPEIYLVRNPAAPGIGKKDKLRIPVNIWKAYQWP